MSCNAFLSYYPFDTLDVVSKLKQSEKISQLTEKLGHAAKNMTQAAAQMHLADVIGFFAVPEYYFTKKLEYGGGGHHLELYSEEERDELYGKLLMLSDRFNHTVILPGTVTWRRSAPRPVPARRQGKQVILAYEGLSSAPAFYAGHILGNYDKVMNDGTIDGGTDDTRFVSGTASPLFEVGNLKCGFEICGDFNEKNLAKAAPAQSLDFEFMMSATNYHRFQQDMEGIPVRNGGYFLHIDQAPAKAKLYNGVWCVNRGSGSHGRDISDAYGCTYDPWTAKPIKKDLVGQERSAGHAIAVKFESSTAPTSGIKLPGQTPFAGLRLHGSVEVTGPLDSRTGRYEITLAVELTVDAGSTSTKVNRTIQFSAKAASVRPSSANTNGEGKTSAVFTCSKDQAAKLTASFHEAKVVVEAKVIWLGAGDITKISVLKALAHPEVPTFLTPIA
jgi:predicted amidohydrolase